MRGVCTDLNAMVYHGQLADEPTLSCLWRGRRWVCEEHPDYWTCRDVGAAPAESQK